MKRRELGFTRPPTTTDLFWAPERAAVFALDVSLVLAIRALKAAHPLLEDPDEPMDQEPLHLIGESILATARSLHALLDGYQHLVEHLTRPGDSYSVEMPAAPTPQDDAPESGADDDF